MTTAALRAADSEEILTGGRSGKHKLDELDPSRVARHLLLFYPGEALVESLMAKARLAIPGLAATADILRVLRHNPNCMFAIARKAKFNPRTPSAEGFIAILPLNAKGLHLLALDTLNRTNPDIRYIAKPGERPAGIYMWCVFAPGPLAAGMALFMQEMATSQYAGVNLYSRPNTDIGRRFNRGLGRHARRDSRARCMRHNCGCSPARRSGRLYDRLSAGCAAGRHRGNRRPFAGGSFPRLRGARRGLYGRAGMSL